MSYYQCKRCLFISKQKTGMIRHLERKNKVIFFTKNKLNSEKTRFFLLVNKFFFQI